MAYEMIVNSHFHMPLYFKRIFSDSLVRKLFIHTVCDKPGEIPFSVF